MTRGRLPLPVAIKKARGEKREERLREGPAGTGVPIQPTGMTARAKVVWEQAIRSMEASGVLAEADSQVLAAYCESVARYQIASARLRRKGMYVEWVDDDGKPHVKHDYALADVRLETGILKGLANELGLTPAGRARMSSLVKAAKPVDPFAEYLGSGKRTATG